jgi:putative DNA methylase
MKVDKAMLASSIFLVARKRGSAFTMAAYESEVAPELGRIVRDRVDTLWEMGISGADLVIACVGAGLRAFTKYGRVEYGNGEEVPDILWRYTYGSAELDAGEAIIFANGTHVELDGPHGLTQGRRALLEKKKSKYRLRDNTERGDEDALGQHAENGNSAPTVDALHRLLWLLEHRPLKVPDFLTEAKPNIEEVRLVAQALAGPALKGGELADVSPTAEQSALGKLLANWNSVMIGKAAVEDRRAGQERLFR